MSAVVSVERHGPVAVLTIDNPPVNAASHAVRAGLVDALARVAEEPAIRGAIIACVGRSFVAGADIAEFGRPPLPPALREVLALIDGLGKPVLALLHGTALGGGFELALACAYRLIDPSGAVGLPEVTLGLIPGAGGTQRLPRLVGAEAALEIMTSGRRVPAAEALALGLVDGVTEGDRLAFALAFMTSRLDAPIPRLADRAAPAVPIAAREAARTAAARRSPGQIAPQRVIEVVAESAGKSFAEGLAIEAAAFAALREGPQSRALRHIFFAERAAAKGGGTAAPRQLRRIGIIGAGTMGAGIATACLLAGLDVTLAERDAAALGAGRDRVAGHLDEAARRGKLTTEARASADARLASTVSLRDLAEADLVIEAVFEDEVVKSALFRDLDAVLRPGAVLASNTSYLDIDALAGATGRPADVIGLHFFSPAHVMRLVEIVAAPRAAPDAVATGFALARCLGKIGVRSGNAEGFIGNRILSTYRAAAEAMVEDGASIWAVDAAMRGFGFPLGVFEMQDLAGLDIGWARRRRRAATCDPRERQVHIADRICERGTFGRKSGRGFYLYEGGQRPDPDVDRIVEAERRAKGILPRPFAAQEIEDRILLAAINAGARLLDEGIARCAGDIDVVMVAGYGFPRWRGGPMHAAEEMGLTAVTGRLTGLAAEDPLLWQPAAGLVRRAAAGDTRFDADSAG